MVKCVSWKGGLEQNTEFIQCSQCLAWYHVTCTIADPVHQGTFICNRCYQSYLPFSSVSGEVNLSDLDDTANDSSNSFLNQSYNSSNFFLNQSYNDPGHNCVWESSYFDVDAFNNLSKGKTFNLIHFNSRSLNRNFDAIKDYLSLLDHNFTVMGFTETWLRDNFSQAYSPE